MKNYIIEYYSKQILVIIQVYYYQLVSVVFVHSKAYRIFVVWTVLISNIKSWYVNQIEIIQQDRDISQQVFAETIKLIQTQNISVEDAQKQAITIIASQQINGGN